MAPVAPPRKNLETILTTALSEREPFGHEDSTPRRTIWRRKEGGGMAGEDEERGWPLAFAGSGVATLSVEVA
jgi:hypothetical protein